MARQSIYIHSFAHKNPIPNACRIGNVIASGLIRGPDPATQTFQPSMEQQCAHMFENMRLTVEAGGGTTGDIIKVTFWMGTIARKPINDEWVKMFPDAEARPARQVMVTAMEPDVLVQCDFMAVLPD
jgi:enamine deaminase RidA (YjgF/YER057c/UK114 family)